MIETNWSSSV